MKKIMLIDGSPRKNMNTAAMLSVVMPICRKHSMPAEVWPKKDAITVEE